MRARRVFLFVVFLFGTARAQPAALEACLSHAEPTCGGNGLPLLDLDCHRSYYFYNSRIAWYPLKYVGPFQIDVEAIGGFWSHLPLYIEIVPLPSGQGSCEPSQPGLLVGETFGNWPLRCNTVWASFGPIYLTGIVPEGGFYALQLVFFETLDYNLTSPAVDCVRVTPMPSAATTKTWTQVKTHYR